jgi:DNA sulfur modification protein DndD
VILDELVLHNVGTFEGRHVLQLTPPSPSRPVVLVGGLNGAGKTTILEAIHLALYGALANLSGRRNGSYDSYLRGLIHRGVPQTEGAVVELRFHAYQEGVKRQYWVRRSWRSTGASIREVFLVNVDGKPAPALGSSWNEHVETFLPRGIAGLFFFDGEQIEALADMNRSREVLASALAALLGLDLVDRLSTDLSVLRRRHNKEHLPSHLLEAVEARRSRLTALRKQEEEASAEAAQLRVQLERAEKQHFIAAERFRSAGGDLYDKRKSLEENRALLNKELRRLEDELRGEMAEQMPLLQTAGLLAKVLGQARREADAARERVIIDAVASRDEKLLDRLRSARVRKSAIDDVIEFLDADRRQREATAATDKVTGLASLAAVEALVGATLPGAARRLDGLLQRLEAARSDLDDADRVLAAIPTPEALAPLADILTAAENDLARSQAALAAAEERVLVLRQEHDQATKAYEAALNESARENLAADDDRRLVDHIDRVRGTLAALRVASAKRHLGNISRLILEALGQLLRKERLITDISVDPDTYTVTLTGPDGAPLTPQLLSAGERQLLAVAILWGLARAAGQPLPVVIDTPLGRLDGSHREHLLTRYFPHVSHQVILLSTDTEIDAAAYRRIAPRVGRTYRLEFDPSRSATSVRPGYLWE